MTYSINNLCNYRQGTHHHYKLKVLQQPIKARLCSFKEKVDRRPIDPPPIVQLCCTCQHKQCIQNILHSPYFFLYATLTGINDDTDLYLHHGHRTTAGAVVQSLHRLKYNDNKDGGFFVFADISVRLEGRYRLKFTLFEIVGETVQRLVSVISDPFTVYSPKYFPGMSESTLLTKSFSDQGVRIRIRKDTRHATKRQKTNSNNNSNNNNNNNRLMEEGEEDEDEESGIHYNSKTPSPTILPPLPPLTFPSTTSSSTSTSLSKSAMSMQNLLSPPLEKPHFYPDRTLPPPTRLLSNHPYPSILPPQFPDT